MTEHTGRGHMTARLDRIPAAEAALRPAPPPPKTGMEVICEHWRRNAESPPVERFLILDHDQGRKVLWSGTEADFRRLQVFFAAHPPHALTGEG